MANYKTLDDLNVAGQRVLVRCDLNVPMKEGAVSDATRIERSLPTLRELSKKGARVIVLSHFGRPKGKVVNEMSLRPVAKALGEALSKPVAFATDCTGAAAAQVVDGLENGHVAVLENLRFHAQEEENDAGFAAQLAGLGDLYVNDAFSCAHRAHASTEALARLLPAAAGRLMQAELDALTDALEAPQHPVAAIVGGAKISTKMDVLGHLSAKTDLLIIGGAMANTFLLAQGYDVGKSLVEAEMVDQARAVMAEAAKKGCDVVLPLDACVGERFGENVANRNVSLDSIPTDWMVLDIGPASITDVSKRLEDCKTLVWNGPFGAFEIPPFDSGTNAIARVAARLTKDGKLLSVAGGGDTVAALANAGVTDSFSYISTAGGAFLEWLEGKELPGVAVLKNG